MTSRRTTDLRSKEAALAAKEAQAAAKEAEAKQARQRLAHARRQVEASLRRDRQQTVGVLADQAGLLAYDDAVLHQAFLRLALHLRTMTGIERASICAPANDAGDLTTNPVQTMDSLGSTS